MTHTSLKSIEVESFKNFAKTAILDVASLPVGLHMVRGRNLVSAQLGSNGSGKSTFFSDAPTWCLSGQTANGLKTTDVRSWLTKQRPRVMLTLQRDEEEVVIQRGPRASDLTIGGRTVGQDEVDAIDGLNHAIRCQAIFMGQGAPLFLDLTPRDKMGVLSDALGLDRWEERAQAASARARALEASAGGVQGQITGLEAAQKHAQASLRTAQDASASWSGELARRLAEAGSAAQEARSQADKLEERRKDTTLACDLAGTKAKLLRPIVNTARAERADGQAEIRSALRDIEQERRALRKSEEMLSTFSEQGSCPTCGQDMTKKDAAQHAAELRATIAEHKKLIRKRESSIQDYSKAVAELEARLVVEEARLEKLEVAESKANDALLLLERGAGAAQARATAAERRLSQIESEENPHHQAAQDARKRLRELTSEIREKKDLLSRTQASAEHAQFWARGFREIRLGVIDDVVADLTDTTAEVLDGLGIGDWEVRYATEQETKSGSTQRALVATVRSPSAPEGVHWESYSGGERQRLRLAGALALSEVLLAHAGSSLNFRVLDEPTRGLSREGVRDLLEVLSDYAKRSGLKIFYIDHTSEDGSQFESVINVVGRPTGATIT